jgi:hypothetical protein
MLTDSVGLSFIYYDVSRDTGTYQFRYIYWRDQFATPSRVAFENSKIYSLFRTRTTWDANPTYPYYTVRDLCSWVNGYPAEMWTYDENTAATSMTRTGPAYVGLYRNASGAMHLWSNSTTPYSQHRWPTTQPADPTKQCVEATQTGEWNEILCSKANDWTLCTQNTATFSTGTTFAKSVALSAGAGNNNNYQYSTSTWNIGNFGADFRIDNIFANAQLNPLTSCGSSCCNIRAYGHTAQLALTQCIPGSDEIWDPQAMPAAWVGKYQWSTCSLFVTGNGYVNGPSAGIKGHADLLQRYMFFSWNFYAQVRFSLHFSWILWTKPNTVQMQVDIENGRVYSTIVSNTINIDWNTAASQCKALGPIWSLAKVDNVRARVLTRGVANETGYPLPLYHMRNATGGAFVDPDTLQPIWFQNFADGQPDTNTDMCLESNVATMGQWNDVACNLARYRPVICETTQWTMWWPTGMYLVNSDLDWNFFVNNVLLNTGPTGTTKIYGMTVYAPRAECRPYDYYHTAKLRRQFHHAGLPGLLSDALGRLSADGPLQVSPRHGAICSHVRFPQDRAPQLYLLDDGRCPRHHGGRELRLGVLRLRAADPRGLPPPDHVPILRC